MAGFNSGVGYFFKPVSKLFSNSDLGRFMKRQEKKLNTGDIWVRIVDTKEVKNYIVTLNTEEQLYQKGINSEGVSLKEIGGTDLTASGYSPVTIEYKKRRGGKSGRIANITLYDTGDFYESHRVEVTKKGFKIIADPIKQSTNLYSEWGEEITGLTEESLEKLIKFLLNKYIKYTREVIFKR